MKLNPKIPLSDKYQSRIAALAIVSHGFDMKRVVRELRPDLKCYNHFGAKLLEEPMVRFQIEYIMNDSKNDAKKFLKGLWNAIDLYWSYLNDPEKGPPPKHVTEVAQTAMRLLGRGYIREKGGPTDTPAVKPMVIEGLGEGIQNLTGNAPVTATDPKKVM